jgi:hypothetical protein
VISVTHGHSLYKLDGMVDPGESRAAPQHITVRGAHEMTTDELQAWAEGIEEPETRRRALEMAARLRAERGERATE